jgi:O-antigen ligase
VLAALTGVIAVLVALGAGFGDGLQAPGGQAILSQEGLGSLARVRLAGLSAAYALFWFAVVQVAGRRGGSRLFWLLLLAGIGLSVAISFNRNMWLGLAIGGLLMAILGGSMVRNRMAVGLVVATGGLAFLMLFGSSETSNTVVRPIIQRGATILNPTKTEHESSLQDRERETSEAWATAQSHLLLGVGAGTPFGVFLSEPITRGSYTIGLTRAPQLFLHNQYLYLVLIAGIPGLIAFLLFLGLPIVTALRRTPTDPAIVAIATGLILVMISSVVAIYFTVEDMTAVLGLLTGILVADLEGRAAKGEPSGLLG